VRTIGAALPWSAYGDPDARHVNRFLVQTILEAFVESFYGADAARQFQSRLARAGARAKQPRRLRTIMGEVNRVRAYALDKIRAARKSL
jgi:hypothetical protein